MSYVVMPKNDWEDILDSVRSKTQKNNPLVSGEVAGEIGSISGDIAKDEQVVNYPTITENGSYEILPDSGKVMSKANVEVAVPERYDEGYSKGKQDGYTEGYQKGVTDTEPNLIPLDATENREYTPSDGVDGYSSVTVNVPLRYDEGYSAGHETGLADGKEIGRQEGYEAGYQKGYDDNQPVTEPLTATENGVYTPSAGVDGYSEVTVDVNVKNADTVDGWHVNVISDGSDPGTTTKPTIHFVYTAG